VLPAYTEDQEPEIIADFNRRFGGAAFESLEELLTSEQGIGLTSATDVQRAVCRIAEGVPLGELADTPGLRDFLGLSVDADVARIMEEIGQPEELLLLSGIRTAKSLIAAGLAIRATQTCDLSNLLPTEVARVSVVSLSKDLAAVIFGHIRGAILSSHRLKALMVGEPTADTITLRHPSGRHVEIKVVAGARAGGTLVARWCAGCIFDDAGRMMGADDAVVNLEDARTAIKGRLLPGAQVVYVTSPWAPFGPIYNFFTTDFGKPRRGRVVLRIPAKHMNPVWWTDKRAAALKEEDATAYQTDYEARFADITESLFPEPILEMCKREAPLHLEPNELCEHSAAMDPATRGNAWTLVICRQEGGKKRVAFNREWKGSPTEPLSPRAVLEEAAKDCERYGLDWAYTDQWAADANKDLAEQAGLSLVVEAWNARNKVDAVTTLATRAAIGEVELPPDPQVLKDLKLTKKKVTQNGVAIVLPKTPDGRHCDYTPAIARAMFPFLREEEEKVPTVGTPEHSKWLEDKLEQEALDKLERKKSQQWWEPDSGGSDWLDPDG
jgi:hypothetical protein